MGNRFGRIITGPARDHQIYSFPQTPLGSLAVMLAQSFGCVMIVVALGGLGYFAYLKFMDPDSNSIVCHDRDVPQRDFEHRMTWFYIYSLGGFFYTLALFPFTAAVAPAFVAQPLFSSKENGIFFITTMVLCILSGMFCQRVDYDEHPRIKFWMWLLNCTLHSLNHQPIIWTSRAPLYYPELLCAALIWGLLGMSHLTPGDTFSYLGDTLGMMWGVVVVGCLGEIFASHGTEPQEISSVVCNYFGLLVVALYVLYDSEETLYQAACSERFDPVCMAERLYDDLLQIYVRIHMLLENIRPLVFLIPRIQRPPMTPTAFDTSYIPKGATGFYNVYDSVDTRCLWPYGRWFALPN